MKIELPPPTCPTRETIEQAIRARRSCRDYLDKPISLAKLSQLLWSAQGITSDDGHRAVPSAGAQYPLQVHVVVGSVSGLSVGFYKYNEKDHSLSPISNKDHREVLRHAALEDQPWLEKAASIIVISADFDAARDHFREQPPQGTRGDRYVYLETGAAAENVYLQAIGLDIGVVLVAGFDDSKVKCALKLPQELEPTALLCIGAVN